MINLKQSLERSFAARNLCTLSTRKINSYQPARETRSSSSGKAEHKQSVRGGKQRLSAALANAATAAARGRFGAAAASLCSAALLHPLPFSGSISKQREYLKYPHRWPLPFHKHVSGSSGSFLAGTTQPDAECCGKENAKVRARASVISPQHFLREKVLLCSSCHDVFNKCSALSSLPSS